MPAADLEKFAPRQQYFELDYLKAILRLLPMGSIWVTLVNLMGSVIEQYYQDTIDSTGELVDTTDSSTEFVEVAGTPTPGGITGALTPGNTFVSMLSCFAAELARLEVRCMVLFREQVPGLSSELLTDWERLAGLQASGTTAQRQDLVHARLYSSDYIGLTPAFYIDYAATLGFVITITQYSDISDPFYVAPIGIDPLDIGSRVGDRLSGSSSASVVLFTIVSGTGDVGVLKSEIQTLKPGHVVIIWSE